MIKNIFSPLTGALSRERALDIIANNLANTNTTAFKQEKVSFQLIPSEPEKRYFNPLPPANYRINFDEQMPFVGNEHAYVSIGQIKKDFTQGPKIETRNPLDMMIEGDGFFVVQTHQGVRYTRAGEFSINKEGVLTTKSGLPILGKRGLIYTGNHQVEVNQHGEIYLHDRYVDSLQIASIKDKEQLENIGYNLLYYNGDPSSVATLENPHVEQGALEGSNVNAIANLTAMILTHRSVEAYQKTMRQYDQIMDKSANRLGVVRV